MQACKGEGRLGIESNPKAFTVRCTHHYFTVKLKLNKEKKERRGPTTPGVLMRETPFQDSTMPDGQKLPNGPSSTNGHSETQCTTRIDEVGAQGTVHRIQCTLFVEGTVHRKQCKRSVWTGLLFLQLIFFSINNFHL